MRSHLSRLRPPNRHILPTGHGQFFTVLSVHAVVCDSLPQDAFGNVGLAGLIGKTGVELGAIRRVIKKIKTLPQQNKVNALGSGTGEEENWILSSIAVVSQGAVKSN